MAHIEAPGDSCKYMRGEPPRRVQSRDERLFFSSEPPF